MVYFADKARAEEVYNKANIKARMGLFEDALFLYDQAIALSKLR